MFHFDVGAARAVPGQRQLDLLAAALVHDDGAIGQRLGVEVRRAGGRPLRTKCFIERFRRAQQRAVEHRVGTQLGLGSAGHRMGETPGLDALLPAAEHEGHVIAGARRDEEAGVGLALAFSTSACATLAMPFASVLPAHRRRPRQSFTATSAPATGAPRSSEVTHTSAFSRPIFTCTPRLVASTAVRTNIGAFLSSSASPRRRDSISTTWKPSCASGMPTTSRLRVAAGELWQLEALRLRVGGEQRDLARGDVFSTRRLSTRPWHRALPPPRTTRPAAGSSSFCAQPRLVVLEHLGIPCQHLGIAVEAARTHDAAATSPRLRAQLALHVAQRHRQHGARALALDDAEGAAANLAIGGASPVATASGKLAALASGRPALSFSPRAAPRRSAFSASGVGKAMDCVSSRLSSLSNFGAMAAPPPVGLQPHLLGERARQRRREAHRQRPDRQAGVPACSRSQENDGGEGRRT